LYLIDEFPDDIAKLPFQFYFDNLFTTVALMIELHKRGFQATGTVRKNYFPKEHNFSADESIKKKPRGYFESEIYEVERANILYSKWKDSGVVSVASTLHNVEPTTMVKRWSSNERQKISVRLPNLINMYARTTGTWEAVTY